jgi:hypothetical protein
MFTVSELASVGSYTNRLVSSVEVTMPTEASPNAYLYTELLLSPNPAADKLRIGFTNQRICRLEAYKNSKLVAAQERGFKGKLENGTAYTLTLSYQPTPALGQSALPVVRMQLRNGTGLVGSAQEIAEASLALPNLLAATSVERLSLHAPQLSATPFGKLQIWKDYRLVD